jgi:hypothetical protein
MQDLAAKRGTGEPLLNPSNSNPIEEQTMTANLNPRLNGNPPRKSLAQQLDRLDSILDGLDQGLSGAISDALKEIVPTVVAETLKATLLEIVTNPDILALLRGNLPPASPPSAEPQPPAQRPTAIARVGQAFVNAWAWSLKKTAAAGRAIASPVRNAYHGAVATYRQINAIWHLRRPIMISLAVGAAVGVVVGYLAAPWLAGVVSGVGAMSATMSAQIAVWTRRLFGGLSMT